MTSVTVANSLHDLDSTYVVAVPYFKGDTLEDTGDLIELGGDGLRSMLDSGHLRSERYDLTLLPGTKGGPGLLLVGAGERGDLTPRYLMQIVAAASRYLTGRSFTEMAVVNRGFEPFHFGLAASEGAIRGAYNAAIKKTKSNGRAPLESLALVVSDRTSEAEEGAKIGQVAGEAGALARDLVNLPPNELTPSAFAERAQELAGMYGLHCEVLDESEMRRRGMGSLLGVAAGSGQPPRLIVLRYGDGKASTRLALVGKGLTFDSGGLSLKTAEGMETMKGDMGGGAAVVAGMVALARLGLKNLAVTGYVGATENMPGGEAMRPGDVLTAMNGETIEVLNTDAEGRLVLADVLSYAVREGATHIVDFATLTGGAVVALGKVCTLAAGRPSDWVGRVVAAANDGLERAWQMPLFPEYRQDMDSEVADIKNTGGRAASALTAASFLGDFVGNVPWAHMDIAGTAWNDKSTPYMPVGGTGEGVATIISLARHLDRTET